MFFSLLYPYLLNLIKLNYSQTIINKCILINYIKLSLKSTINHFLKNCAKPEYNFEIGMSNKLTRT